MTAALIIIVIILVAAAVGAYYFTVSVPPVAPTVKVLQVAHIETVPTTSSWWIVTTKGIETAAAELNSTDYPIKLSGYSGVTEPNVPPLLDSLGDKGFDVVILPGAFRDYVLNTIGPKYPNTQWVLTSVSFKPTKNVGVLYISIFPGYYAAGLVAGFASKSHKIGFIDAYPVPIFAAMYNAYALGAKKAFADTTVSLLTTNEWSDPTKGAAAVDGLIATGVDVIAAVGDGMSVGAVTEAQTRGIYSIGYLFDNIPVAPNSVLASVAWNPASTYRAILRDALKGALEGRMWSLTMVEGSTDVVLNTALINKALSPDQVASVTQTIKTLQDGSFYVPSIETFPA